MSYKLNLKLSSVLVCLGLLVSSQGIAAKAPTWKTYTDAKLGFAFEYPDNRQVKSLHSNAVALISPKMKKSDYIMAFRIFDASLEKIAMDEAGFEKQNGKWMTTLGRGLPQVVKPFSMNGLKGMKATISCGINNETGFHATAGECFWAVVSDGKHTILMDTQGIVGTDQDTMRSVNSLRFIK